MNEKEFVEYFSQHAFRKADMYDGVKNARSIAELMRFAIEELGEVAAAITRNRPYLAIYECVDLAHCAMLIALVLHKEHGCKL